MIISIRRYAGIGINQKKKTILCIEIHSRNIHYEGLYATTKLVYVVLVNHNKMNFFSLRMFWVSLGSSEFFIEKGRTHIIVTGY